MLISQDTIVPEREDSRPCFQEIITWEPEREQDYIPKNQKAVMSYERRSRSNWSVQFSKSDSAEGESEREIRLPFRQRSDTGDPKGNDLNRACRREGDKAK